MTPTAAAAAPARPRWLPMTLSQRMRFSHSLTLSKCITSEHIQPTWSVALADKIVLHFSLLSQRKDKRRFRIPIFVKVLSGILGERVTCPP